MIEQIISALIGKLVADEVAASVPGISGWLLKVALSQLQPWQRSRLAEEWASHLEQTRGTLHKLYEAAGFWFAARRLGAEGHANLTKLIARAKEQFAPNIAVKMQDLVETGWAGLNCDLGKRQSLIDEMNRQSPEVAEYAIMAVDGCAGLNATADFIEAANRVLDNIFYEVLRKQEKSPK